jgi:hypothetical protein
MLGSTVALPTMRAQHLEAGNPAGIFELSVPQPDCQGFWWGFVRVAARSILAAGKPSSCRPHQPIGVVGRRFEKPPLTPELGGATRDRAVGDESASRNWRFESIPLQQRVGELPRLGP